MAGSEARDAGARRAAQDQPRPAVRLVRTVRRVGWLAAAATAILMGGGFQWTLAEAAKAPPTSGPLPAAEQQVVQQSNSITQRVSADQRMLAGLEAQVAQLTGAQGAAGGSQGQAMPRMHSFTGAS